MLYITPEPTWKKSVRHSSALASAAWSRKQCLPSVQPRMDRNSEKSVTLVRSQQLQNLKPSWKTGLPGWYTQTSRSVASER